MCFAGCLLCGAAFFSICHYFDLKITVFQCTLSSLFNYGLATGSLLSYAPTVICRFNEIVLLNQCSRKLVVLLLLFPYTPLVCLAVHFFLLADSVQNSGPFCRNSYSRQLELFMIPVLFLLLVSSFAVQVLLSFKLCNYLRNHFTTVSRSLRMNRDKLRRLRKEKSILFAISIQGFAPLILATPTFVLHLFKMIFGISFQSNEPLFQIGNLIQVTIGSLTFTIYMLNPLVDSLAVLYVMTPYVTARKECTKKLANNFAKLYQFFLNKRNLLIF